MKIICTQENLNKGLSIVGRTVSKTTGTLPILNNILLKTEKGRLKLSATDLEIGISCFIGGKVEKEGAITIPARLITEYVRNLPNEKIEIELKNNILSLKCKSFQANINGINAEEFPLIPQIKETPFCSIKGNILKNAISQTIFAAALDESRPEIAGVYMNFSKPKVILAATDSYRLIEKTIEPKKLARKQNGVIIPAKVFHELARILSESEDDVEIALSENQILFNFGDSSLISRLVEGQYPDYKQIIPEGFKTQVKVDIKAFSSAIKNTSLFAKEGTNDVVLSFNAKENSLEVEAEASQVGKNISKVQCEISGNDISITFNYRYLLDGLNAITSSEAILEFTESASPGVIKPSDSKDYVYVVMPIKQ